jgi:hypothetical protein
MPGRPIDEVIEAIKRQDQRRERFLEQNRTKLKAKPEPARIEKELKTIRDYEIM